MTIKTEGVHAGEFLLSEANGSRSRENIVITAGSGRLVAGTLIAPITAANALSATAAAGNTGDGTVGATVVTSAAISGTYVLEITEAGANGGKFEVVDPQGRQVGTGQVGQAFTGGGIGFTLSDGATDFVVGDRFNLQVLAGLGSGRPTTTTVPMTAVVRLAEFCSDQWMPRIPTSRRWPWSVMPK